MIPTIKNHEDEIKRISIFVSDLLHSSDLGEQWMKQHRSNWKGRNAIEMIKSGKMSEVIIFIHARFF